jgi:DsbC/DsbD-like thiol-disulfide interchange protein
MMMKTFLQFGCAIVALATPVFAQDASQQTGLKNIEVLNGWHTGNGTYMAAVRFSLEDGWKTYWRAPGQNGIPPSFNWEGSANLSSVKFHWPAPKVYVQNGISTLGYKGDFILPFEVTPSVSGEPIKIKSQIEYGICSDVCIPASSAIDAVIGQGPTYQQDLIKTALAKRPLSADAGGVYAVSCQIIPNEDGMRITASITFNNNAPDIDMAVIEFAAPNIWIDQSGLEQSGKAVTAQADLVSFTDVPLAMDQDKLRITLIGSQNAIEINGCPIAG